SIWQSGVGQSFVLLTCSLAAIFLFAGMVSLIRAFKSNHRGWSWAAVKPFTMDNWGPIAATSVLVMTLALLLSANWVLKLLPGDAPGLAWLNWLTKALRTSDFRLAMFSSLRSLDLGSGISALLPL